MLNNNAKNMLALKARRSGTAIEVSLLCEIRVPSIDHTNYAKEKGRPRHSLGATIKTWSFNSK